MGEGFVASPQWRYKDLILDLMFEVTKLLGDLRSIDSATTNYKIKLRNFAAQVLVVHDLLRVKLELPKDNKKFQELKELDNLDVEEGVNLKNLIKKWRLIILLIEELGYSRTEVSDDEEDVLYGVV